MMFFFLTLLLKDSQHSRSSRIVKCRVAELNQTHQRRFATRQCHLIKLSLDRFCSSLLNNYSQHCLERNPFSTTTLSRNPRDIQLPFLRNNNEKMVKIMPRFMPLSQRLHFPECAGCIPEV